MRKLLKFLGWTLGLALAAGLAAFLALKLYFTPDRIRKLVVEYAGKNLGREISLDAAALSLRGFSIKNLRVAETGGFKKGEFLSAADFSVRPDFRALLKKEFRINSIRASGVTVTILQAGKDGYNFSDMIAGSRAGAAPKPAPGAQAKPMEIGVSNISVTNSRIIYANADRSMTVTLSGLNLKAEALTSDGLFPFEADFTLGIKSSYLSGNFPVYAKGRTALGGWDPQKGRAEIEKATLKAGNISCALKGNLENLVEPGAKITLRVNTFSSTDLKPYFPAIPARILLPSMDIDTSLKLTSKNLLLKKLDFQAGGTASGALRGRVIWDPAFYYYLSADIKARIPEMDTTEVARKFRSVPKNIKIPLADITASLKASPAKVQILSAGVTAKSLKISASGQFTYVPEFAASGRLAMSAGDLHDLGAMFAPLKDYDLKGKASADAAFSMGKAVQVKGTAGFEGLAARAADMQLSEFKGRADFSTEQLRADAAGKLDGSAMKLVVTAKNYPAHPQVTLNADLAALKLKASALGGQGQSRAEPAPASKKARDARPFAFDIAGKTRLGAIAHPNMTAGETLLTYNLKNISDDLKNLSGTASFEVNGGKFDDLYELAKTNKAAKVALMPMLMLGKASKLARGFKLPDFNTIAFTSMEGDYVFRDGVMKIQKSSLNADVADADMSGTVNLVSYTLDLKINTRLKQASGITLSAPVGMTVKGTFDNPSVKADIKSIMEQPAVRKNIKNAEKLLKSLFKK